MRVFGFLMNKVLLAACVALVGASLVLADQNDRKDRDNKGSGPPPRPTNVQPSNQPARSFSSGNSGTSGNSARSFSSSNNSSSSNDNAVRNFPSQGARERLSSSMNSGSARQGDSRSNSSGPQFSNKSSGVGQSSNSSSLRSSVLGQQIQNGDQKNTNSSNQSNSNRSFGKFRGNDSARIAENDDHKNKGDNNNRNNGGQSNQGQGNKGNAGQNNQGQGQGNKGNSGQNNPGQIVNKGNVGQNNQGQNNSGQNNKGQNKSDGQDRDGGNVKRLGDIPGSKTGIPFNGKNNNGNLPGNINGLPGTNNGSKFDPKNADSKNGDHRDKDFKFGDQRDKNHDGIPDNQQSGKDSFGRKTIDNRSNSDRVFHDRDFHGNDASKAAFKKWNDVWTGKDGHGKDNRDWSGKWRNGDRFVAADAIRHDFFAHHDHHDHDWHNMPFQASWWDGHHGHDHGWNFWGNYASHHHHHPWYWWSWASAPALATYCNFGWGTPYYWDYGPGEYIYCNGGNVYVNGRLYEPVPVYYAQTVRLIDQAPLLDEDAAADADWMPLGVFAVTPDGENQPSVIMQLAITKNGILGGTATDQQAGTSFNIQGTVDQKTQRAVWSYVDAGNHRIVMESSVNNLTQDESTGLIHYSANDQRVVEFVRMPEPDEQGQLPMPQTLDVPGGEGPALPPPEGQ
jgi:hypothetical protein